MLRQYLLFLRDSRVSLLMATMKPLQKENELVERSGYTNGFRAHSFPVLLRCLACLRVVLILTDMRATV